ncbi:MerR family transcriptional regulator [Erythrobacter sp. 3-20A1M]|uniref:MerR family transcriptional regulator n=1 Tax=Erythrobacter sp. 3-20A1M TaxID=2653850 RepID=UPI001BFCBFF5|nr:MerR family transcriptional regulator [Erythrobacter sp. 3-20A1M]QWC56023.1 MerR family transcriptional regulator [Erythrobacter sp. 3-20A1M]
MAARFEDGKDEGALRTIGEVSAALNIRPHVLRYWEEQFPMLQPLKRSGNRRYYRTSDVALVEAIDRLVNVEGYTIKGARQAIADGRSDVAGRTESAPQTDTAEAAPDQGRDAKNATIASDLLSELTDIRDGLAKALNA